MPSALPMTRTRRNEWVSLLNRAGFGVVVLSLGGTDQEFEFSVARLRTQAALATSARLHRRARFLQWQARQIRARIRTSEAR
jgi:hypothetical protein